MRQKRGKEYQPLFAQDGLLDEEEREGEFGKNLILLKNFQQKDVRVDLRMQRVNILVNLIKETENKLQILYQKKEYYYETKEYSLQKQIDSEITIISKEVSQNLRKIREKMRVMENKLKDFSQQREDQIKKDTDIRMMKTILNCFQGKLIDLLKRFQIFQLKHKKMATEFTVDSLMMTQNDYTREDLQQFTLNQLQELQVEQRKKVSGQTQEDIEVNNALNNIREKVIEIKKIEKQVNELVQMISELSMLIQAQSEVINSIADNVNQIDDYVDQTKENIDSSNKLMTSANEKLWCFFTVLVFVMIIIMNSLLNSFFKQLLLKIQIF